MRPIQDLLKTAGSLPSQEITQSSAPPVPDSREAAIIGAIIDRARLVKGWGRLPEKEQDTAVVAWYEILVDAGVPAERWNDCYRSAQARRNELKAEGKQVDGIIEPNDLVVEWGKIRSLHYELDKSRLLPENAAGACLRCDKQGREIHLDGSIGGPCDHRPLTNEEKAEASRLRAEKLAEGQREAQKALEAKRAAALKAEQEKPQFISFKMECSFCQRRVDTDGVVWREGGPCGAPLPDEKICEGEFHRIKKVAAPV